MEFRYRVAKIPRRATGLLVLTVTGAGCGDDGGSISTPQDPVDTNQAPVAAAGSDQTVSAGLPVALDGSGSSDADGDDVGFTWTLDAPDGSAATLTESESPTPTFVPDTPGAYTAILTVSDGSETANDSVTVTAEDNTAAATLGPDGGELTSTDGLVHFEVPPGALEEEAELRVTLATAGQLPEAISELGLEGATTYDLQPAGLTFAVSLRVTVRQEGAVVRSPGGLTFSSSFLFAESQGALEPLDQLTSEADPEAPGDALTTGELGHFSSITRMDRAVDYSISSVTAEDVASPFDATLASRIADLPSIREHVRSGPFEITDQSTGPVRIRGLPSGSTESTDGFTAELVREYECTEGGSGSIDATVITGLTLYGASAVATMTANLETGPVNCTTPLAFFTRDNPGGLSLSMGYGPYEILVAGASPEIWDTQTQETTSLAGVSFAGDRMEHLHPVGEDGTALYGTTLFGRGWAYRFGTGWEGPLVSNDQVRQFTPGPGGVLWGASGVGELNRVWQDTLTDGVEAVRWGTGLSLQAVYGDEDAGWGIGVRNTGEGNPFFDDAVAVALGLDPTTPLTPLSGTALGRITDGSQLQIKSMDCHRLTPQATYACAFAGGERDPGFLTDGQEAREGSSEIFTANVTFGTANREELGFYPGVGVTAFRYQTELWFGWADQFNTTAEFRRVSSETGAVEESLSVPLGAQCRYILDFAVTRSGDYAAFSCQAKEGQPPRLGGFVIPLGP